MARTVPAFVSVALLTACPFDPENVDPTEITSLDGSSSEGSTQTGTATSLTSTTQDSNTTAPTTTAGPDTGSTTDAAECGDGSIDGVEVCDDGVNDGAYGGCMPGCGSLAPHCGDGEVNGSELCDDGTNDDGYGGCATDCSDLGPHCGDAIVQMANEGCDNGTNNQNGAGCNIDCTVSGSVQGFYDYGVGSFCDGSFVTKPLFRDNGNVLVGATGYCDDDTVGLVELAPDATLVQAFDDLLLPNTPIRESILVDDDWILATYGCNYRVSAMGDLTEICETRNTGQYGMDAADDGSYAAVEYDIVSLFPSGSPTLGDAPTWSVNPPDNASYDYSFYGAARGASDSVVIIGTRRYIPNNTYSAYVARYTAVGNTAGSYTFAGVERFEQMAVDPSNGSILGVMNYPAYTVYRLDSGFNQAWQYATGADSNVQAAIDSTGAVVLQFHDAASANNIIRKLTPDGNVALWTTQLDNVGYNPRIAIDASDAIWIASTPSSGGMTHFTVTKVAP
ncbi:MAG: hypothetical protein IPH07_35995 [Deltaproteobacteria bacterium]|nr:hypothetical protein [Deltaproteobacteria bacterium]MBK8235589.1 hypothetical protein [Deltaproteobacteria bacterium]MBK8713222.1 hypothetical protein [Deltaproteobacteria bacterium]MBP7288899.1 hypothetical protein [Nannocystaceae bacterium]